MGAFRLVLLVSAAVGVLVLVGPASGGTSSFGNVTCSGGIVAPGTYDSLTVTGFCSTSSHSRDSTIVRGNLTVARGAGLNAITESTLIVNGNVWVGQRAFLGLGCSPAAGCLVTTHDRIGSLFANEPLALIVHSNQIKGDVTSRGGGGGVNCDPGPLGGPTFSTFEDNEIGGNVSVTWMRSCWFGFIRNVVHGNVLVSHNTFADEDATEIVTNRVLGDLACFDNDPVAQVGDSGGAPNVVSGHATGECEALSVHG
jgi:hypothetical protein